jgi:Bacterial Ig-like domain
MAMPLRLGRGAVVILFMAAALLGGCRSKRNATAVDGIPPIVVAASPADSSTAVPTSAMIVFNFSEAMDRTATEGAFSIVPPVTGAFNWGGQLSSGTRMEFRPSAGLAGGTSYVVTLAAAASDLAGNALAVAPYVVNFATAGSASTCQWDSSQWGNCAWGP